MRVQPSTIAFRPMVETIAFPFLLYASANVGIA